MRCHLPLCFVLVCSHLMLFSCISCISCISCVRFVLLWSCFGGVDRKVPDIKILWPINFLIITGSARDIKKYISVSSMYKIFGQNDQQTFFKDFQIFKLNFTL